MTFFDLQILTVVPSFTASLIGYLYSYLQRLVCGFGLTSKPNNCRC